jgi:hypothetical protein
VVAVAIAVTAETLAGVYFFKWKVRKALAAINTWASAGSTGPSSIPAFAFGLEGVLVPKVVGFAGVRGEP